LFQNDATEYLVTVYYGNGDNAVHSFITSKDAHAKADRVEDAVRLQPNVEDKIVGWKLTMNGSFAGKLRWYGDA
jgi:hypothetical protein